MAKSKNSAPMTDRDWRAEGDCETLMRAEQIKRDPKRMKAAQVAAKQRLEEAATLVSNTTTKE